MGELRFDWTSGELLAPDGEVRQLPPQPTALLALLVDRAGEVVTHEEIRAALWPDVTVDFDGSLHHCVRQVRAALGDQAKAPRFIETIPRRGYRLRPDVARAAEVAPAPAGPSSGDVRLTDAAPAASELYSAVPLPAGAAVLDSAPPVTHAVDAELAHATPRSPRRQWLPLALALLVAALGAWRLRDPGSGPNELRIAIMGFGSASERTPEAERIREQVLADLANRRPDTAIVGPRTTDPLHEQGLSLPQIATTLDVAYVLNARHLDGKPSAMPPTLLVELIRTSDGKHVWVRRYEQLADWRRIATEITDGAAATIP